MPKYFYISFIVLMFLIPFVSFLNFYPIFRFGMFASSIDKNDTIEVFKITASGKELVYDDFPLPGSTINYLARKHYYQNTAYFLLSELHDKQYKKLKELQLHKIKYDFNGNTLDSVTVCKSTH